MADRFTTHAATSHALTLGRIAEFGEVLRAKMKIVDILSQKAGLGAVMPDVQVVDEEFEVMGGRVRIGRCRRGSAGRMRKSWRLCAQVTLHAE